jgi:hypothetical protein
MRLLLTGIAALLLATGAAHATLDGCAVVLRTPDGFLNLRAAPTMKARVVARLKPGEILYDTSAGYTKGWMHITDVNRPGPRISGWAGRRFVIPIDCEMLDPPTTADNK